jgi:hypothetical protein
MLTREERERFETVMRAAISHTIRPTRAAVLMDAFDCLPPDRQVAHFAHLLQHFCFFEDEPTKTEQRMSRNEFRTLQKRVAGSVGPLLKLVHSKRPPLEEAARMLWSELASFDRPERDVALAAVLQSRVFPYARMPEVGEFALEEGEFELYQDADKPAQATALFIGMQTADPEASSRLSDFAAPLLTLLENRTPKERTVILSTFMWSFQQTILQHAKVPLPDSTSDDESPPPKGGPPEQPN